MNKTVLIFLIILIISISSFNVTSTNSTDLANDTNNTVINSLANIQSLDDPNSQIQKEYNVLTIEKDDQILLPEELFGNHQKIKMVFNEPEIHESTEFSEIIVKNCSYSMVSLAPMLPQRTITLSYEPGTIIKEVTFQPEKIQSQDIETPIISVPQPYPVIPEYDYEYFEDQLETDPSIDSEVYRTNDFYPNNWFEYYTGMGLNPISDERTLFLVVHISPVKYQPVRDQIQYITSGNLEIIVQRPEPNRSTDTNTRAFGSGSRATTHDMVIICPSIFKAELTDFAKHKTNTGINTIIVTTEEINTGTYFQIQGRDPAEKIKYFIHDAIVNWEIKYVLLVGDEERIPTRITHVDESGLNDNEAADLYFADIFESGNNFCDWDFDNDDRFGEYNSNNGGNIDKADLFPDVHIGRFPASTSAELSTLVDKTKTYEITAIGQQWYKNTVLNGLDTFSGGTAEGEYLSDHIARNYLQDFNNIKLYESTNTLTTQNIKSNWNSGAGFVSFSDHGLHSSWGNKFSSSDVSTLTNGYKLPFVNFDACLTGEFDQGSTDCMAEKTILNSNGGGIAVVASSRIAYGSFGISHINSVSGYLNVRLYHNMKQTTQIAGALLTNAKIDYLRNIGSSGPTNFKTLVEYNYFGDPSLLLGGLPTAIYNLKCEDNSSQIKPGNNVQYTIQVENTDIQTRQIILSTSNPPPNWAVKLSEKSLTLMSGEKRNVTMTVTAPSEALAGSVGEITVFGTLANIERNLCVGTKTKIKRVYGFELISDGQTHTIGEVYPGKTVNFTFEVSNLGNAEEKILLTLISEQEDSVYWKDQFNRSTVTLPAFSKQNVKLSIDVPQKTVSMDYLFNISGKMESNKATKNLQILLYVHRIYTVEINCSNTDHKTDPNVNLTFHLNLDNQGNHLEDFKLFLTNMPNDWKVWFINDDKINDTFKLPPFSFLKLKCILNIPQGTIVGNYNLTLFAQIEGLEEGSEIYSTVDFNIRVNRVYGIKLNSQYERYNVTPGETINRFFDVINLGNFQDFADLEIVSKPDNWIIGLEKYNDILLNPNNKRALGVTITPYEKSVAGPYNIIIRGTIQGDNSYSDLKLTIDLNRITGFNISNLDPDNEYKAGESWEIKGLLTNLGNDEDTVTITIPSKLPFGEVISFDTAPIKLKAFAEKEFSINLILNEHAVAGKHNIPITARLESTQQNQSYNVEFSILHVRGIELEVFKDRIETQPGKEIKFLVTIYNRGNSKDNFTFRVSDVPEHWTKQFPNEQTVTLKEFSWINKTLYFNVPDDEQFHDIDMEFMIQSKSDSKTNYILPVTISVKEENYSILGFEEGPFTFMLLLFVIIVICLALIAGLLRKRSKRYKAENKNIIEYSTSSDGSRVEWDESSEPIGDQYKPPTPLPVNEMFELQVVAPAPNTYRKTSMIGGEDIYGNEKRKNVKVALSPASVQSLPVPVTYNNQTGYEQYDTGAGIDLNFNRPPNMHTDPNPQVIQSINTDADIYNSKTQNYNNKNYNEPIKRSEPLFVPDVTYPAFVKEDTMVLEIVNPDIELEQDFNGTVAGDVRNDAIFEELDPDYEDESDTDNNQDNAKDEVHIQKFDPDVKIFEIDDEISFKKPKHYKNK